jgi:hypothetical protein
MKKGTNRKWLQPLFDALRTTDLGRPKAQEAFNRHLDLLDRFRTEGYTYKDLANVLADEGVTGRKAKFSEQSLQKYHGRAQAHANKGASAASSPSANVQTPAVARNDGRSGNHSHKPAPANKPAADVQEFMRTLGVAKAHSAKNAILQRRGFKDI